DVVEITAAPAGAGSARMEFSAQGTVLFGTTPRVTRLNGIAVESALEGTVLLFTNKDVPGVIGAIGTMLGREGMNIATFALGRKEGVVGHDALALVGPAGRVSEKVCPLLKPTPNVLKAKIIRLPALVPAAAPATAD